MFYTKCHEECNTGETLPSKDSKFSKGVNRYQKIMVQSKIWLSKNVWGVHRNDVSRLAESSRKKMLIILPNPSVVCGLAESAFCEESLSVQILQAQLHSLNQWQFLEG